MKYKLITIIGIAGSTAASAFGGWDRSLQTLIRRFICADEMDVLNAAPRNLSKCVQALSTIKQERLVKDEFIFEFTITLYTRTWG